MEKIINNLKKKNKEIEEAIIELFEFYNKKFSKFPL